MEPDTTPQKDTRETPAHLSGWGKFWFALKVIQVRLRFIAILVISGVVISYWDHVTAWWEKMHRPPVIEQASQSAFEYFCPMHTFIIRSEEGKCPICGMPLVQRKKGAQQELPEGVLARVQVSPERIAQAGVEVVPVDYRLLARETRVSGIVDFDEKKLTRVTARFPGWIEKLYVNYEGAPVKKGDPLVAMYSPKYLAATEEYVQALNTARGMNANATDDERKRSKTLADFARQRLLLAGFEPKQLDQIDKTRKATEVITYESKTSGIVVSRNVLEGEYVSEGEALCTVADLSRVWVQAQVPESDIALVKPGLPVELSTVAYPGEVFFGNVDFVAPLVDAATRTVRVRVEVDNAQQRLRPGMYATVVIRAPLGRFEEIGGADAITSTTGETSPSVQVAGKKSVYYQCDMDPEVISDKPGDCPKCGMHLTRHEGIPPKSGATSGTTETATALTQWAEGYTCAMHPDYLSDKPGVCEICPCRMTLTRWRVEKALAIPEKSIIDTGTRKIVYVEEAPGVFDARDVKTGPRAGEYYPVISGLTAGDRIAAAGSFLIDAENRLNPAPGSLYAPDTSATMEGAPMKGMAM